MNYSLTEPKLSPRYHPELEETYLQQSFVVQGRLGQGDFGEVTNLNLITN